MDVELIGKTFHNLFPSPGRIANIIAVLDSGTIIKKPEIIAKAIIGFELVVPIAVKNLIRSRAHFRKELGILLEASHQYGIIKMEESQLDDIGSPFVHYHSVTECYILRYLEHLKKSSNEVLFVSDNQSLVALAQHIGVCTSSASVFPPRGAQFGKSVPYVEDLAFGIAARELAVYASAVILGFIITSIFVGHLLALLSSSWEVIAWLPLLAIPMSALLIYILRGRFRLLYGIAEFSVGCCGAILSLNPILDIGKSLQALEEPIGKLSIIALDWPTLDHAHLLQMVAGVYVMVRGLDNVGKAFAGTRLEAKWKKLGLS